MSAGDEPRYLSLDCTVENYSNFMPAIVLKFLLQLLRQTGKSRSHFLERHYLEPSKEKNKSTDYTGKCTLPHLQKQMTVHAGLSYEQI